MRGKLNDRDAKCPFFCAHTKDTIVCEGVIPDSHATLRFEGSNGKKIQYAVFCCWNYQKCERYRPLQEKYRNEDEPASPRPPGYHSRI